MTGYVHKDEALAVLRAVAANLVSTMRGASNVDAIAIGTWTIRDVAVHLGDAFETHRALMENKAVPLERMEQSADINQQLIDANPERDINVLADRVEELSSAYFDYLASIEGDPIVPWAEFKVPLTAVMSADIGECLMHGYDIAHAEDRPFPIDPHHAAVATIGVSPMSVNYVDADATRDMEACFNLKMRGHGEMDFIFDHGTLTIEKGSGRKADVHISADPVALMLVGYGRMGVWGPALTGKIIPYGRKPWLALRFPKLLKNP